jgi:hypothetical protein
MVLPALQPRLISLARENNRNPKRRTKLLRKIFRGGIIAILMGLWLRLNGIVLLSQQRAKDESIGSIQQPLDELIVQEEKRQVEDQQEEERSVKNVLTYFLEPSTTLDSTHITPLPRRRTSAEKLQKKEFPRATCSSSGLQNFPIDDFPLTDPFLPWIHDYFVVEDHVRILAQNRRRCETGKGKEITMKYWEPQIALFQPVPVQKIGNTTQYRLSTPQEAIAPETRFFCRFHNLDNEETTFSTYSINYEFINWRKHQKGDGMFVLSGPDVNMFEFSNLVFSCPIPQTFRSTHQRLWLDVIPIRTPARRGKWMLTEDQVGPDANLHYFDPAVEYGNHALPAVVDSGRIANIPLCPQPPPQQQHRLVVCTWTAASYRRRGDHTIIEDAALRLQEWIVFHKVVGVDHMYVYDNTQTDDDSPLKEIANRFPDFVTYHPWPAQVCSNNRPNHKVSWKVAGCFISFSAFQQPDLCMDAVMLPSSIYIKT